LGPRIWLCLRPVTFDAMSYDDVTFRPHDGRSGTARQGRHLAPSRSVSNIAAQLQGSRMPAAAARAGTTKAPNFASDRTALLSSGACRSFTPIARCRRNGAPIGSFGCLRRLSLEPGNEPRARRARRRIRPIDRVQSNEAVLVL